jgi:hypothetical protein
MKLLWEWRWEGCGRTKFYDLWVRPDWEGNIVHQGIKFFMPYFGGDQYIVNERAHKEYLQWRELTKRVSQSTSFPPWIRIAKTLQKKWDREEGVILKRWRIFKEVVEWKTWLDIIRENTLDWISCALIELAKRIELKCKECLGAEGLDINPETRGSQGNAAFENLRLTAAFEQICINAAVSKIKITDFMDNSLWELPENEYVGIFDFWLVSLS